MRNAVGKGAINLLCLLKYSQKFSFFPYHFFFFYSASTSDESNGRATEKSTGGDIAGDSHQSGASPESGDGSIDAGGQTP